MSSATKPKVLITDNINKTAVEILKPICDVVYEKALTAEQLQEKIEQFEGLLIRSASQVGDAVLAHASNLQIIGRAGVGTDNIDLPAATQRGVIVVNSPDGNTVAASEHTLGMIFALSRHIPEGDEGLKKGEWNRSKLVGVELFGKTLGIIGLGRIGTRVAKGCLALGMKVNVFDPFLTQRMADELGVALVKLEDIWAQSDFITIHAPKTKDTANLINVNTLAKCQQGVRIINCARGGMVNEKDLADAIRRGHVAGAAFDVFDAEPATADNPLVQLRQSEFGNRIVLTPHLGASTEEAQINVAIDVAEQLRDFFQFGYARSAVNLPMLRKEILDPVKHYMPMAEVLGKFVRQTVSGVIQSVDITVKGTLADPNLKTEPLTLAVLKGILASAREGVNYVNAMNIAEERGIQVKTASTKKADNYLNLLEVSVTTDEGNTAQVAGTLISDNIFRIVQIDTCRVTLEPTPYMLMTPHHDRPGMVARVATTLGAAGVNISGLQVARQGKEAGGKSLMIFNLDNAPSDADLAEIRAQEGIYDAIYICV